MLLKAPGQAVLFQIHCIRYIFKDSFDIQRAKIPIFFTDSKTCRSPSALIKIFSRYCLRFSERKNKKVCSYYYRQQRKVFLSSARIRSFFEKTHIAPLKGISYISLHTIRHDASIGSDIRMPVPLFSALPAKCCYNPCFIS